MPSASERLRRSKRNKFRLDFATLNSSKTERRKTIANNTSVRGRSPSEGVSQQRNAVSMSPEPSDTGPSSASPAPDEDGKRSRRPIRNNNFVYDDDSDDDPDAQTAGMVGANLCSKCPSRFETKPGLANHFKLHGDVKRKFNCDQCDFSCGSAKASRNHRRCHQLKKPPTPSPGHSDTRSDSDGTSPAPLLSAGPWENGTPSGAWENPAHSDDTSPPVLDAIPTIRNSPVPGSSSTPLSVKYCADKSETRRNRCASCPFASRSRRRFEKHTESHQKQTGFRCHKCSLTTPSSGFLKRHITEIHKDSTFPWPPRYFVDGVERKEEGEVLAARQPHRRRIGNRAKLLPSEHSINDNSSDLRGAVSCPVKSCDYVCPSIALLVYHKRRCHPIRLPGFPCTRCGLHLRTRGALRLHRLKRHPKRKLTKLTKLSLIAEVVGNHAYKKHFSVAPLSVTPPPDDSPTSSSQTTPLSTPATPVRDTAQPIKAENDHGLDILAVSYSRLLIGRDIPEYLRILLLEKGDPNKEEEEMPFCCPDCPFGSQLKGKLDRHVAKHHVPSDLQCPLCSFACRGEDMMLQHVRLHLSADYRMRCAAAAQVKREATPIKLGAGQVGEPTLSQPPSLKKVVKAAVKKPAAKDSALKLKTPHNPLVLDDGSKARECLECPYFTRHACDLTTHINMHLNQGQRYQCPQCSYSTKRSISLRSHFEIHRRANEKMNLSRKLVLNGAQVGFAVKDRRNQIMTTEEEKGRSQPIRKRPRAPLVYLCRWCPFASSSVSKLWAHARCHIFNRSMTVRCSVCVYYGHKMEVMEDHILMHSSNQDHVHPTVERVHKNAKSSSLVRQRYQCDYCPFNSVDYRPYWRHRVKANHMNMTICQKCNVKTTSKSDLDEHMKHHKNDPRDSTVSGIPINPVVINNNVSAVAMTTTTRLSHSNSSPMLRPVPSTAPSPTRPAASAAPSPAPPILFREEPMQCELDDDDMKPDMKTESATNSSTDLESSSGGGASRAEPITANGSAHDLRYDVPLMVEVAKKLRPNTDLRFMLEKELAAEEKGVCCECPFADEDEEVLRLHRACHSKPARPQQCELCTYSCHTPEALHQHISLHLPHLSPKSEAAQKRLSASARRRFSQGDVIPAGVKALSCNKCPYRTMNQAYLDQHKNIHAQDMLRRLQTTMKRSAVAKEEAARTKLPGRSVKKSDNMYCCKECSFRSATVVAISKHLEMHGDKALLKCRMCSYGANTRGIMIYHEANHHGDHTLTNLRKCAILAPQAISLPVKVTKEEYEEAAHRLFRCKRCDFSCLELRDLHSHWESGHNESAADKETIQLLSMGMVRIDSLSTPA